MILYSLTIRIRSYLYLVAVFTTDGVGESLSPDKDKRTRLTNDLSVFGIQLSHAPMLDSEERPDSKVKMVIERHDIKQIRRGSVMALATK